MKKIIPFLLFLPLLVVSIYIGFTQFKSKVNNNNTVVVPSQTPSPTLTSNSTSQINLFISSPQSGITVNSTSISVSGTTGSNVNVVVNDQDLISNADGTFKTSVLLDEGENYISVVAYDDFGNTAEREIMVMRTVSGL